MVIKKTTIIAIAVVAVMCSAGVMAPQFLLYEKTEATGISQEQYGTAETIPGNEVRPSLTPTEPDVEEATESTGEPPAPSQGGETETGDKDDREAPIPAETTAQEASEPSVPENEETNPPPSDAETEATVPVEEPEPEPEQTLPLEPVPEETSPGETVPTAPEPDPLERIYSSTTRAEIQAEMAKRGSCGRLFIPGVGVDVAIFDATLYDAKQSQPIVDAEDSAAYMTDGVPWWGFPIVADHVHQGFAAIKKSVAGETVAYMHFGDRVEAYMCTRVFRGYNEGTLTDLDGNPIKGTNPGGLCMYTCNSDGSITITFWQPQL